MSFYANQQDARREGHAEGLEEGIKRLINVNKKHGCSKKETEEDLIEQYGLTEEDAAGKVVLYW